LKGKGVAEPEVVRFHELLNAGDLEKIYSTTAVEFQQSAPKEKILALFSAIKRKLGPYQSSKELNWNVNTYNLTTNVVLVYQCKYEQGEATETFTYRISNEKPQLLGYNISSLDMLLR
jgi:hypothetical protein